MKYRNGAVAGALLGAYHSQIPEKMLDGLQLRSEVESLFDEVNKRG